MSALLAARKRPSGLTVEPMNLPNLVTSRSPSGLITWSSETWSPLAYCVPTVWLPKTPVEAEAMPPPTTVRAAVLAAAMRTLRVVRRHSGAGPERGAPLTSDLHDHPFEELREDRSTRPSICHKGLAASPLGVRTWK